MIQIYAHQQPFLKIVLHYLQFIGKRQICFNNIAFHEINIFMKYLINN